MNFTRKNCKIIFLQDLIKFLQESILQFFLQDFLYLARKAILVQEMQDLVQDFSSLARKILIRFAYFLQGHFYWVGAGKK